MSFNNPSPLERLAFQNALTSQHALPALLGIGLSLPATQPAAPTWPYVRRRFTQLLNNLAVTSYQASDGQTKQAGVRACLNRHYYENSSETANSMLIGSWGKRTRVRPPRDIDILFLLPPAVYWRFQERSGNKQSQLLQEVRGVLAESYPQTKMRGDGQVVVVPFNTTPIEVAPGFRCTDGTIIICDTNQDGRYKTSTAEAELNDLTTYDALWNGNLRALIRMMKQWQRECNVPLKSFQFERLAIEFLQNWPDSNTRDVFWYDWMVRDFLGYLIGRANGYLFMPGSGEYVTLGSEWLSRAQTAYRYAVRACDYERDDNETLAGGDWQQIFGSAVNVLVS